MTADYLSKSALKNSFTISSGGISALNGTPATVQAIQIARELGLNLMKHVAKGINGCMLNRSDLILWMTKARKFHLLHNFEHLFGKCFTLAKCASSQDISDPYGEDIDVYRKMAMDIRETSSEPAEFLFLGDGVKSRSENESGDKGAIVFKVSRGNGALSAHFG
jgi:protein-tyrosine-phosphatase